MSNVDKVERRINFVISRYRVYLLRCCCRDKKLSMKMMQSCCVFMHNFLFINYIDVRVVHNVFRNIA